MRQCSQDRVQDCVEVLADIFSEEAQHEVAVLLQEQVFAPAVGDQLRIKPLKLDSNILLGRSQRSKSCRQNVNRVFERARCRLRLCIDPMTDRLALHKDNWVMTVFPRDPVATPT